MKIIKGVRWCGYGVFFFLWSVLSPVSFHGEFNKTYDKMSHDGNYKIVAYDITPSTPYSLIQLIIYHDVFLVLYNKDGKYLGQSSPFHFSDWDGVFGGTDNFPKSDDIENDLDRSFFIAVAADYESGYQIPADHMHWWSRLLSVFY